MGSDRKNKNKEDSPVTKLSAILARLVFVISERTVQRSKFTQLVALVVIGRFGGRGSLGADQIGQSDELVAKE